MNTATAPDNLEQQLGEFGRNAGQMSEIERKQAAEGLIEQLKREVAVGADPRQTFEEIQRLTPYVEADARRREAPRLRDLDGAPRTTPPSSSKRRRLARKSNCANTRKSRTR